VVEQIEEATGQRFTSFTASRYRAAAGLPHLRVNTRTAPLNRSRAPRAMWLPAAY